MNWKYLISLFVGVFLTIVVMNQCHKSNYIHPQTLDELVDQQTRVISAELKIEKELRAIAMQDSEAMANRINKYKETIVSYQRIEGMLNTYRDSATIGYLHEGDNREVWISSASEGADTWCFSLTRGRWFSVEGNRTQFYDDGRKLYAVNAANNLQRESAGTDAVTVHIKTGRLHLGQVDKRKRVWGTVIKWRIQGETLPAVQFYGEGHELLPADYRADRFRNAYGSMLYYALEIQGDIVQGDWIQSFDIKHERRLEHRLLQV